MIKSGNPYKKELLLKKITKNNNFSEKQIDLDIRLLNNYYKSNGYYDVKINSSSAEIKKTGEVDLTYSINAGERYIIKKILTNVDPVFDKKIFFPLEKKQKNRQYCLFFF